MLAFAESEFLLSTPQPDGLPLRAHLETIARQTKVLPEELANAPDLSPLVEHLWHWFCELNAERMLPNQPPQRITAESMKGLEWLYGIRMALWEKKAIKKLDNLFFKGLK